MTRFEFTWSRKHLVKARRLVQGGTLSLEGLWQDALRAYRLTRKPKGKAGKRRSGRPTDKLWRELATLTFCAPWGSPPSLPILRRLGLGKAMAAQMGRFFGAASDLIAGLDIDVVDIGQAMAKVARAGIAGSPRRESELRARIDEKRAKLGLPPFGLPPPPPPLCPPPPPPGSRPFPTPPRSA